MKRFIACLILVMAVPLAAQQPQRQGAPPPPPPAPQQPPRPAAPQQPLPPPGPEGTVNFESGGQPVNIRLDISVVDQSGEGPVQPKTLMVILADRAVSRIRSEFEQQIVLDARATLIGSQIRVSLTIGARVYTDRARGTVRPTWDHIFSLLLESGKPVVAFESAEAASNRKLTIEVKATILK